MTEAFDRKTPSPFAELIAEISVRRSSSQNFEDLIAVFDEADDPILITEGTPIDPPGPQIVWANRAFSALTGYERDEVIGETPRLFQGPDTSDAVRKRMRSALRARESVQVEVTNYRKDGEPYEVVLDIAPLFDGEGTLTHWISFHRDVTEQRRYEEMLRYEATHDSLTGLANRAALQEELQALLETPTQDPAALLYLDLDRFKLVNDSLGHSRGDELLMRIAQTLRETTREQDVVARIGGDEFAVCLPRLDAPEQAQALAEHIYETLNQPIQLGERTVFTPASIGIVIGLSDYDEVEAILRDADTAMYEAKEEPHRAFAVYEQTMTHRVEEQLSLDTELRQALEQSEFVPFFHPVITLEDGCLHGFEVLARWRHPENGILAPDVFLDAAEATGLIVPIGHQVIRKACQVVCSIQERRDNGLPLPLMANFSRQEFFRAETHAFLTELFADYEMAPSDFTMEISERTVANISEEDISAFHALKDLGVAIILDDFGTGFSSLQSLRRLPVDGLKIDKDLLTDAHGRPWDRDLVDLIVQMGHTLDQTVTAEGVETEPQLQALREMGCSYGQGFLFSRPVPASQVEALLDAPSWNHYWHS